jgi:hypothetical protein
MFNVSSSKAKPSKKKASAVEPTHFDFREAYQEDLIDRKDAEEFINSVIEDLPDEFSSKKNDLFFALKNQVYLDRAIQSAKMILLYSSISLVTYERASFEDLLSAFPKQVIHPDQVMLNELMVNYIRMENKSEIRMLLSQGLPDHLFEDRMDRLLYKIKLWAAEYL